MPTLISKYLLATALSFSMLLPLAVHAEQIAADAGQFVVQARLVQSSCVPEFTERSRSSTQIMIKVALRHCLAVPHLLSVKPVLSERHLVLGSLVSGPESLSETVYFINAHSFDSTMTLSESLGATLQVTYL